jgi:mannan endo-1,4-beta-mannosidase
MRSCLILTLAITVASACAQPAQDGPIDPAATAETRALLANLKLLAAESRILFGHQDPTAYGVGWTPEPGEPAESVEVRADVYRVAGDFAPVYGWGIDDPGYEERNIDGIDWGLMRDLILRGYERGGVHVFSWHGDNPKTGGNAWDTTRVVPDILPGGAFHDTLKARLDGIAGFIDGLESPSGAKIPVIFRPYHEHNGGWFWWGATHCTPEEYVALWRFTVEYLRDVKGLHHVLYAYSPDRFTGREAYLERYPGDDWVDILGFDDYYDFYGEGRTPDMFAESMATVAGLALERGKVAALTETGLNALSNPRWYSEVLLPALKSRPMTSRIAFLMVWRNAWPGHFYVPYPGHEGVDDFLEFVADPMILMERDIPDLYRMPR